MAGKAALDNMVQGAIQRAETPEEPDILIGSREQVLHLLAEAAEIEHALMCSYLYALFSLKPQGDASFSAYEDALVSEWRRDLLDIAVEEMGHLMIVANLTVAVGGRPHFARPNFPVTAGYFPTGVTARLTPFSPQTLEHFIHLERPTGMVGEDAEGFGGEDEAEPDEEREQAWHGLMPGAQGYATVSHLYEAIRSNILAFVARAGEESLFVGGDHAQITRTDVGLRGIEAIRDSAGALRGIDLIIEQGEGSAQEREDSHYRRFRRMKSGFDKLKAANPAFAPAWPAAEDPVLRRPPEGSDLVWIEARPAAQALDFANACYGLLLRLLVQVYGGLPGPEEERQALQGPLLAAAFGLMHVLARAGEALARLPASPEHPGVHAGMTFTMLRGVEPFLGGHAERVLILERLEQLSRGARLLGATLPEFLPLAKELDALTPPFLARP